MEAGPERLMFIWVSAQFTFKDILGFGTGKGGGEVSRHPLPVGACKVEAKPKVRPALGSGESIALSVGSTFEWG